MSITVRQATIHDLDLVAPLFDAYRVFYGQAADIERATRFLRERFQQHDSIVILALNADGEGAGFVQLYPTYSSVRTSRSYLLNDLFVAPNARRGGVAAALMHAAMDIARALGASGMTLATAHANTPAQHLYESLGWQRDAEFREYFIRF